MEGTNYDSNCIHRFVVLPINLLHFEITGIYFSETVMLVLGIYLIAQLVLISQRNI